MGLHGRLGASARGSRRELSPHRILPRTVFCLDMFWAKLPEALRNGDIVPTLKRQRVVNMLVALGATSAAVMLLIWVSACGV